VTDVLTPAQRRTLPAREALAAKFTTPEQKSEHYRALAERSNAGRIVLSAADAEVLARAYALLGQIVSRSQQSSPDSLKAT
jgi:hypothetical protein